jgi:hypothetical protein
MDNRISVAVLLLSLAQIPLGTAAESAPVDSNPLKNAYFGDLHVHTSYSSDARIFGTVAGPDEAYRFARGKAIDFQNFGKIQLKYGALDFMAVTDHAEYLGVLNMVDDPEKDLGFDLENTLKAFNSLGKAKRAGTPLPKLDRPDLTRTAWQKTIEAAQRHNEPGVFTTFVGFEWTLQSDNGSSHRNVIFRGEEVSDMPFSMFDSSRPEDLWTWLDTLRDQGKEGMAIPHNSNLSGGDMWPDAKSSGEPIDSQWAKQRMRNEALVEVTQVKGTSEANPLLSPDDQWADFEIYAHLKPKSESKTGPNKTALQGSYARAAYKKGISYSETEGFNPYKFGLIGSTDSHNAASSFEEEKYFSKGGKMTATPEARLLGKAPGDTVVTPAQRLAQKQNPKAWGASGIAGVWAEQNTRESIYDAFRRKETFATTGTRIQVRFFAGYDYADDLDKQADRVKQAYAQGVSMGGDLTGRTDGRAPKFLVWAARDANSAPLQRIQIIKGWVENGETREKVFDVVGSDGLVPDSKTHRIPDNGATVDLKTGQWDEDKGAAQLSALWSDPEFDPKQSAFYYARVLENPKLRWSTHDANTLGIEPLEELPTTIQERAYTSPIWYSPKGK